MPVKKPDTATDLFEELDSFFLSGFSGRDSMEVGGSRKIPVFINEFWTNRQRQAHSLHEISYRACFKPQLPRFFVERLTEPGDVVFDPFLGRGTTLLEAALLGRVGWGTDVNPLTERLVAPRLKPPSMEALEQRLKQWDFDYKGETLAELEVFYHPETLKHICWLRDYFAHPPFGRSPDSVDRWIQMVATNRLTGHSSGFFSVYTLPPNQAVSVASQRKINRDRKQIPPFREVKSLILKKSKSLLRSGSPSLLDPSPHKIWTVSAHDLHPIINSSVSLVVTSPPFLDVVDYKGDNWLRCWFNSIDPDAVPIWGYRRLEDWRAAMESAFRELERVLIPGGWVAFEVGEVRRGKIALDASVVECGLKAGLRPQMVVINDQNFTKTSHCWGVHNRSKGTNTNRIVVFRKG